ncbi:gliding motility protein SprC [Flavobacterium piscis]|uniref:gliding motility protein SprC n=1 Tax=Flavobacterium piscis TaxID=1114874 RepID=UPI00286ADC38|nr:gliding motility protein SprC [Flavobacterium piscis]
MHAQTVIVPQQFDGLEKLCAGNFFNEFNATFTYLNFPSGTTFVLELSDATGSFTNPIATTILQTIDVSPSQQTIKFAVPNNLTGSDIYSLRVKASTGYVSPTRFKNSLGNTSFPAFYKEYENSFFINNKIENAMICSGGSLTLSVYNETPEVQNSSPANYSNIKYKWFKDDVVIAGQSSSTLTVNAVGKYYAEIDYGECSDVNFSSNRVTVTSSSSGSAVTVDSSLGNPFCSNGVGTVLTATSGNSYIWKKDGAVITNATNRTYSTNQSGLYSVEVDFGGCKATGNINLSSNSFEASIDVADEIELQEGETVSVTVTDDASNPTYEWYLNGNIISGATTDTYLVAIKGNYRAKISQASGCISSKEFSFKVNGPSSPTAVIANIIKMEGSNPYWNIPDIYKNENTKVIIISSNGEKVLDVVNYQGDWPQTAIDIKNVNPVYYYVIQGDAGEKKGSITVLK